MDSSSKREQILIKLRSAVNNGGSDILREVQELDTLRSKRSSEKGSVPFNAPVKLGSEAYKEMTWSTAC